MHVHFINLDRSKDRLAEFKSANSHLGEVTRIPAIEERSIDVEALTRQGLVKVYILSMYPVGSLCHALSELALWNKAIETGQPVTIADDDCIFNLKFDTAAPEVIRSLAPDWDLILWGWNFDLFMIFDMLPGVSHCACQFDQDKLRLNTRRFQEMTISPRAHKLIWAFGMICYTVSPKGAQNLKNKCLPLQPMLVPCPEGIRTPPHAPTYRNVGPDNTINNFHRDLQSFVCMPPLVISKNDHATSTIQAGGAGTVPVGGDGAAETKADDMLALSTQALELHRQQRLDEALAAFDRVLALNPNSVETHYNRATILGELNRFVEALAAYDRVLALKPNFVFALNNRGWILQKLQRYQDALASYDGALAVDPDYAPARDNRDLLLRMNPQALAEKVRLT